MCKIYVKQIGVLGFKGRVCDRRGRGDSGDIFSNYVLGENGFVFKGGFVRFVF